MYVGILCSGCIDIGVVINHYTDVIMGAIASQITSLTIVYSTVYSDAGQRKHQSSASLAYVWGTHRGPVNSPHKWSVTQKMFPFVDVIMYLSLHCVYWWLSKGWWIQYCSFAVNRTCPCEIHSLFYLLDYVSYLRQDTYRWATIKCVCKLFADICPFEFTVAQV